MAALADIVLNILGPILLMVGLGALLRWRFKLDLATLSKLNIFLLVPAFVFDKVTTSTLRWQEMAGVVGITVTHTFLLGLLVGVGGRLLRVEGKTLAAVALAAMFYNSGNYGLPLAQLAYPSAAGFDGGAVQSFVLMSQNVLNFTLGLGIAAWAGSGKLSTGFFTLLRLPILPGLLAALLTRYLTDGHPERIPKLLSITTSYLAGGLVPIALVTLGAQLASNPRWPRWKPVSAVLLLRLLYAPLQMAGLLFLLSRTALLPSMSLWPWHAELLILTAGTPTAINTLLLTMELDGDTDLAADCVFWTTTLSALSLTFWLLLVRTH